MTKYDSLNEMEEWGKQLDKMRRDTPERFCCVCDVMAEIKIYDLLAGRGDYNIAICRNCRIATRRLGLTVNEIVEHLFKQGTPSIIDALYRASMHLNTPDVKGNRS